MTSRSAHRCLDPGATIVIGTVDRQKTPHVCRALAVGSADNLATLLVYVPVATSHHAVQSLAATKKAAVTVMHPADNCAIQLKGTTLDIRLARDDEAAFIRDRCAAFEDALDRLGVPRRLSRSLTHWPAFAIQVQVEQVFDQTPGPRAGAPLQ